jgi:hypothetical protein
MAFISNDANATISDNENGLQLVVNGDAGNIAFDGWANDVTAGIVLINWAGYESAASAFAALTPDGHGGTMLPLPHSGIPSTSSILRSPAYRQVKSP